MRGGRNVKRVRVCIDEWIVACVPSRCCQGKAQSEARGSPQAHPTTDRLKLKLRARQLQAPLPPICALRPASQRTGGALVGACFGLGWAKSKSTSPKPRLTRASTKGGHTPQQHTAHNLVPAPQMGPTSARLSKRGQLDVEGVVYPKLNVPPCPSAIAHASMRPPIEVGCLRHPIRCPDPMDRCV